MDGRKQAYLSAKNAKTRLQWAKKHNYKSKKFWSKIMWTKDCLLHHGASSDKVWMKVTYEQHLKKDYVQK